MELEILDFYGTFCPPCKTLSPILEKFGQEHKEIKITKINIDDDFDTPLKYGVTGVPTLILLKDGEEVKRNVGLLSKNELEDFIKI